MTTFRYPNGFTFYYDDTVDPLLYCGTAVYHQPAPEFYVEHIEHSKVSEVECVYCGRYNSPQCEHCRGCGALLQ